MKSSEKRVLATSEHWEAVEILNPGSSGFVSSLVSLPPCNRFFKFIFFLGSLSTLGLSRMSARQEADALA